MKLFTGLAVLAWAWPCVAQNQTTPPDLPSTALARQWIEQDPAVQEARKAQAAAGHTAAMLRASPNEWAATVTGQRRRVDGIGSTSNEWHAQLERPIRINGKADLDRQLGEIEVVVAQARVGEAIHESALSLLNLWIEGLAAAQAEKLFAEQRSFAQANLRAVQSRKRAGDASTLDVNVAAADYLEVERQASLAASNFAKVRAKLRVRYPDVRLPDRVLSDPVAPSEPEGKWLERVLESSDPLRIARGEVRRAEVTAARTSADRVPDPTVGVFIVSESFRNETIGGLSISIPLSGTYRDQRMKQALRQAEEARAAMLRLQRELESAVAETYADAIGNPARWRLAEQGAMATSESARLMQRAYALGEAELQSLLLARRQFLEASRAALEARAEALRSNFRLLVDAHLIWDLSVE